jgi:hypothetical protein
MPKNESSFEDKFWYDKDGNFVVWQRPNWALITWFVSFVLTIIIPAGQVDDVLAFIARAAIMIWALMELIWGVNYFRRLLGLAVLLLPLITLI